MVLETPSQRRVLSQLRALNALSHLKALNALSPLRAT